MRPLPSALVLISIVACGGGSSAATSAESTHGRAATEPHLSVLPVVDAPVDAGPVQSDAGGVDVATADASMGEAARAPHVLSTLAPLRVAQPPTKRVLASRPTPVRSARLTRVSNRPNRVTDVAAWFTANQLVSPVIVLRGRGATASAADYPTVDGHALTRVLRGDGQAILLYGRSPSRQAGPLIAALRDDGTVGGFLDVGDFDTLPAGVRQMQPEFAVAVGDLLYVSHMHRTYASATGGLNAYLSAIDMEKGILVWRSGPLEANTRTFAVVGDVIVTGYGFTDEKDYLYVLDRHTGRRLHRARLESGPRFILERGGRIYVRAYDRDYVYDLTVRTR